MIHYHLKKILIVHFQTAQQTEIWNAMQNYEPQATVYRQKKTAMSLQGRALHYITFIWQKFLSYATYNKCLPKILGTATKHRSDKVHCLTLLAY